VLLLLSKTTVCNNCGRLRLDNRKIVARETGIALRRVKLNVRWLLWVARLLWSRDGDCYWAAV
jgi:hypothetical protein